MVTNLSSNNDRNNNFTPTLRVACNMPRELQHVRHNNGLLVRGRSPAHALPEADLLAGRLAVEGA